MTIANVQTVHPATGAASGNFVFTVGATTPGNFGVIVATRNLPGTASGTGTSDNATGTANLWNLADSSGVTTTTNTWVGITATAITSSFTQITMSSAATTGTWSVVFYEFSGVLATKDAPVSGATQTDTASTTMDTTGGFPGNYTFAGELVITVIRQNTTSAITGPTGASSPASGWTTTDLTAESSAQAGWAVSGAAGTTSKAVWTTTVGGAYTAFINAFKAAPTNIGAAPSRDYYPGRGPRREAGSRFNATYFATDALPAAPPTGVWLPANNTPRRSLKLPTFRPNSGTDVIDGNLLLPPSLKNSNRRRAPVMVVRADGDVFSPPFPQPVVPTNPSITATVFGRLRSVGRVRPPARVSDPTPAQVNPPIVSTVIGRLRSVGRVRPPARVVKPIPPQVNPPIVSTVIGRLRSVGRVRPPARVVKPIPPQVNPPIVSTVIGRLRSVGRVRPPARLAAPVAQQSAIVTTTGRLRRAALRLNRPSAVTGAPLTGQTAAPGTTTRRRLGVPSRRSRVAGPQPVQAAPVAPLWVPALARGLRTVGRTVRRGRVLTPVQAQQAATPNPSITATVFGRLRSVGRVRPPVRVVKPIPPQVNPPIVSTVIGRLRSVGRVRRAPGVSNPVPVQPSVTTSVTRRSRSAGRVRAHSVNVVPTQQAAVINPSITATVFGRLRSVGRVRPPARIRNPTPVQQAVTPNPSITATVFGRLRFVGRVRPPARVVKPIPPQVNPPYPVKPSRVVAFRGSSRRRGAPVSAPHVQPTAETRTIPTGGLRGLRRVWLKIRRKNVTPVPGQVTTLQGPLVITDSYGGTEADRNSGTALGGVYGSAPSVGAGGTSGGFTADPDNDNVTGTYDSDSDTL